MIEQGRIEVHCVSEKKKDAAYVLYWMQQSQRVSYNHALIMRLNRPMHMMFRF